VFFPFIQRHQFNVLKELVNLVLLEAFFHQLGDNTFSMYLIPFPCPAQLRTNGTKIHQFDDRGVFPLQQTHDTTEEGGLLLWFKIR